MEGQEPAGGIWEGRALSATRVDTAIVVAAVAAAVIGAIALCGVLGQAFLGQTPSHLLTYLPMLLLPIAMVLTCAALIRTALRRRRTEVGHS